jgi:protocatechuate 3,4-dioxygenase beta subunit
VLFTITISGCAQNSNQRVNGPEAGEIEVGGNCEGCEAIYESPVPFAQLGKMDTLPEFNANGPRIKMSGTIFQADGKTPAPGVVMYFYHTNQKGIYPTRGDEQGNAKRHGYLRGWIKTGPDGRYAFYTMRPASYPNSRALAHIHATIKEQGKSAYYIEDFFFADDPFLQDEDFSGRRPRGGNGVVTMKTDKDGISYGSRDITLGLNIPGYK